MSNSPYAFFDIFSISMRFQPSFNTNITAIHPPAKHCCHHENMQTGMKMYATMS